MENNDQQDLFPDLPRVKKRRVSHGEMLTTALNETRIRFGVTTPQIAERLHIPSRTIEKWVQGRNLPVEWTSELVFEKLRKFYPR
jgi:DNA-binding transcriptional regulator YiaG